MHVLTSDIGRRIETCLDVDAMCAQLQATLAPRGAIDAVRISKVRRSASRWRHPNPLALCYEIDFRDLPERPSRTVLFYAKLYRDRASAEAARRPPVVHISPLDLLLWPWPADPCLPQLAQLLDPEVTRARWGVPAVQVQALRYEPEQRATLKYRLTDGRVLFAKTYGDGRAPAVRRRFAWMHELTGRRDDGPRVAPTLPGGDAELALWQEAAFGTPLNRLIGAGRIDELALALAHAVDCIHEAPTALAGPAPHRVEHWLAEVERRRKKIGRVMPALADRVDAVAAAIMRASTHLPTQRATVIHGDFHPDQVWFDGQRIVLFDFDDFALGDPMEDLAEFMVKLSPGDATRRFATSWLEAYARIAPQRFCRRRLDWHRAVQQFLHTSRAFVSQAADWPAELQGRLECAERLAFQVDPERAPCAPA